MAIIRGNTLIGVNIGDSRVILGLEKDGKIVAEEFTHDHKPDSPLEKERILAAGGRVFAVEYDDGIDGPPRVWLGHMDVPGLAMSRLVYSLVSWWEFVYHQCTSLILFLSLCICRSLGDAVAHTAGVISDPEFVEKELNPSSDRVIVVATDGLWEFVDNDETINILVPTPGPAEAVDCLVKEANARWMQEEQVIDDTTVIVAHLFGYKESDD